MTFLERAVQASLTNIFILCRLDGKPFDLLQWDQTKPKTPHSTFPLSATRIHRAEKEKCNDITVILLLEVAGKYSWAINVSKCLK